MSKWSLLALLCFSCHGADFSGRVKLAGGISDAGSQSIAEQLGQQTQAQLSSQLRLQLKQSMANWRLQAAWQIEGQQGSAVSLQRQLVSRYPQLAPAPDSSYWDLQQNFGSTADRTFSQRWDRLNLTYSGASLVLRLGRQALTWGAGQVFHPMDLVNPFQPVQLDTAYKRGTDMAYGQWLFANGADIQFALVPHRHRDPLDANGGKPTQAIFASVPGNTLQWTFLAANDRAEPTLGVGINGPLGDNVWNLELVGTRLPGGAVAKSLLVNLNRAGLFEQRNYTAFAEYYHNGFGQTGQYSLAELNPETVLRLRRNQQFVTARDYLALGANWEWTPLLQITPSVIWNINDHSALLDTQLSWSLSDNLTCKVELRLPVGSKGTEFGGLALSSQQALYLTPGRALNIQLTGYF